MNKEHLQELLSCESLLTQEEASDLANELKAELWGNGLVKVDSSRIDQMIAGLGDRRGLIRRTFTESLGKVGSKATPALRKALLTHSNVTVRRAAAKALKLVGDPSALPDLLHALINDPDPVVQGSSAGAMAIFGARAVDLLIKVLSDPQSTAMQCGLACWAMAFIGAEAQEALLKAAKSKNGSIRAAAIAALGDQIHCLQDEVAIKIIEEALNDPEKDVRNEATTLIGRLNEPIWAYKILIEKLNDDSTEIRGNAALSLMKVKAIDAIDSLERRIMKEQDVGVLNLLRMAVENLRKDLSA